jgi:hypothetical protein
MKIVRVQYTVQANFVEQNKKNIEAVMREMRALNRTDVIYTVYVLNDGRTFMHLVHHASPDTAHLPTSLESFKHFQEAVKDHFEEAPKGEELALVGISSDLF